MRDAVPILPRYRHRALPHSYRRSGMFRELNYDDMVMQPPIIVPPVVAVVTGNTLVTAH